MEVKTPYAGKELATHPERHPDLCAGRLGFLSKEQKQAVALLRKKYDWETALQGFLEPGETPDTCILRFLRARQFDISEASLMVENHLQWRKTFDIDRKAHMPTDELLGCSFDKKILPHYPQGYGGVDKNGRLIYIKLVGKLNVEGVLKNVTVDKFVDFEVSMMERGKWIHGVQRAKVGYHCEEFFSIVDLEGFGMSIMSANVWGFLRAIAAQLGDNYPETNGGMYLINTPWSFTMIWKVVKTFVDAATVAKIKILGSDYTKELLKCVDSDQLPVEYGGTGLSLKEICYSSKHRAFVPRKRPAAMDALKGSFEYCHSVGADLTEEETKQEREPDNDPELEDDQMALVSTEASSVTMSEEVEPDDISVSSVSDDDPAYEDDSGFEQVPVLEPQTVPNSVEEPAPQKWNLVKLVVTNNDEVQTQENATIASVVADAIAQRNETQNEEELELLRPIDNREYGNETKFVEEQEQPGGIDNGEYGDEETEGGRSSGSTTCRENSTTEGSISPSVTRKTTSPVELHLPSGDVTTSQILDSDGTMDSTKTPLRTSGTSSMSRKRSVSNETEAEDLLLRVYDEDDVDSDEDDIDFLSNLRAAGHVSYKPTKHPLERNKTAEVEPWKMKDFNNVGGDYHDRSCATPDCSVS